MLKQVIGAGSGATLFGGLAVLHGPALVVCVVVVGVMVVTVAFVAVRITVSKDASKNWARVLSALAGGGP